MRNIIRENPVTEQSIAWVSRLEFSLDFGDFKDVLSIQDLRDKLREIGQGDSLNSFEFFLVDYVSPIPDTDTLLASIALQVNDFETYDVKLLRPFAQKILSDLIELKQKSPQLVVITKAAFMSSTTFRSKGYGSTLYLYTLLLLFQTIQDLDSILFISDYAGHGVTSNSALRVWKSMEKQLRPHNEHLYLQGSDDEKAQVLLVTANDLRRIFDL